jgi:hypothetical protein
MALDAPPEPASPSMPPMSVLAAPLPPPLGSVAEVPAPLPPGAIPRLSLSKPGKPPAVKGRLGRIADRLPKIGGKSAVVVGGKPVVVKPGKTAAVLRKRAALGPMAKVGLSVVVLAVAVGGFFSYRIFFPEQTPSVKIRLPVGLRPNPAADARKAAADALAKAAGTPGQLIDKGQGAIGAQRDKEQAKVDALASGQDEPTPTPTPTSSANETVMGDTTINSDVKVGNTPLDAAPAASAAFRNFVASSVIGGVYQGVPSKALINGTIVREGQVVSSALGIAFERIDADRKIIYFRDYSGAEVSKNY